MHSAVIPRTTLITGANGFVGSAVARDLLAHGHRVRVLVREGSDRRNLDGLPVEIVPGDLLDVHSLDAALDGCDALFHVAAAYRLWTPDPDLLYRVNVDGTRLLMEAALRAGVERIVYTSSVATLGLRSDGQPADETTPVMLADMIGHYKRSKYLAEEALSRMVETHALPAVIVNPSTPVGPRDIRPTPTGRLIRDAATGRMPAYVDTGLNIVHVDDVAAGHRLAFEHGRPGERYVLGGENLTLREILVHIAVLSGRQPPRLRLPHAAVLPVAHIAEAWARLTRGAEPQVTVDGIRLARKQMFFSSAKAERELGYTHRPAAEALADAVRYYLSHLSETSK
ncbi:NAD-dependent dehydratase [Acidihalobacter ferrooxydans]|uniref:NAD-dependent dehydratase n=2 Tax=Acidihalobacter ferrooxydans TaxID=1765967 RepID=A0A1P8UL45_9GAMM|nr:NAD-dependent dehydratase [Acidihalobacter ferrooxydans]